MRRICEESGRATGLKIAPKRRVRCLVCDSLVSVVLVGDYLIIARHYRTFKLPSGDRRWVNTRY
jgi:hypothetical protein